MVGDVPHGLGECRLEVDVVAVGQGQDRPEAVSKLVGQGLIEVIAGSHACLALNEFRQIPNVAQKAEHVLLGGPGAPVAADRLPSVGLPNPPCLHVQFCNVHGHMLAYVAPPSSRAAHLLAADRASAGAQWQTRGMSSRAASVADDRPFYARYAEAYDSLVTDPVDSWVDTVDRELKTAGFNEAAVLDAGCGTGRHARALIERGHEVTLFDASAPLLAIAARRCPGSETLLGDLCRPSVIKHFDAITCRGVLNDFIEDEERNAVLGSLAALTRRRGVLLLDVRESAESQRRADGRWRTSEGRLPDGGRVVFTSRPSWRAGSIVVEERYELVSEETCGSTVHEYRFEMRPWTREELRAGLSEAGFANIEIRPGIGRCTPDRLFVVAQR